MKKIRLAVALGVLVPLVIYAGDLVLPHTFSAGGPIVADEMNANFTAVRDAVKRAFSSGTRFHAVGLLAADGLAYPIGVGSGSGPVFWDSQLGTYCQLGYSTTLPYHCVPLPSNRYYSDASCTQAVLIPWGNLLPTKPNAYLQLTETATYYPVTSGAGPSALYTTGTGGCGPANCAGCCDGSGTCNSGNNNAACGGSGQACVNCTTAASSTCTGGYCSNGGTPLVGGCQASTVAIPATVYTVSGAAVPESTFGTMTIDVL